MQHLKGSGTPRPIYRRRVLKG